MNTDTMSLLTRRTILFHAYNIASADQKIHPNEDKLLQHLALKMDVGVDWYNDLVKGDASENNEKNSWDYCMPPESMHDRVLSFAYLLYMCNVDFESAPEELELVKQFAMMYELTPEAFTACFEGEPAGKMPEEIASNFK